jgi:molecular chaperone GrpE
VNEHSHAGVPLEPDTPPAGTAEPGAPAVDPGPDEAAESELTLLTAQVAALKDEILRLRAELDNQRKRAQRDVEAAHKYANERFVQELLPFKDGMDLGLKAAQSATDIDSLREGVALSHKQLDDFFEKTGIRTIDPVGERFDPEFHQAMTMEESSAVAPGCVLRVMQRGYLLNDRLLRPALVTVARAPGGQDA